MNNWKCKEHKKYQKHLMLVTLSRTLQPRNAAPLCTQSIKLSATLANLPMLLSDTAVLTEYVYEPTRLT